MFRRVHDPCNQSVCCLSNPSVCSRVNESNSSHYGGPQNGALTREDAIIVAYMITVGPQHPGENPFYYSDFIDSGYDTPTFGEYTLPY